MPPQNENIRALIPQLRRYIAQRTGGAETIRGLRDTLAARGLPPKRRHVPYRHQKVLRARAEAEQRRSHPDADEKAMRRLSRRQQREKDSKR